MYLSRPETTIFRVHHPAVSAGSPLGFPHRDARPRGQISTRYWSGNIASGEDGNPAPTRGLFQGKIEIGNRFVFGHVWKKADALGVEWKFSRFFAAGW